MDKNEGKPFRGFRIAGHPVHPAATDFPLALWAMSLLWDLVGLWRGEPFWHAMAYWSLVAGLVLAAPAVISGFLDYVAIPPSHPAGPCAVRHMVCMLLAGSAFIGSLLTRPGPAAPGGSSFGWPLVFSVAGVICLLTGGWFGGQLVFRHGIGQDKPPREADRAVTASNPRRP